jgi:hypothetical protein
MRLLCCKEVDVAVFLSCAQRKNWESKCCKRKGPLSLFAQCTNAAKSEDLGLCWVRSEVGESLRVPLFDSNPDGVSCRFPSKKMLSLSELG